MLIWFVVPLSIAKLLCSYIYLLLMVYLCPRKMSDEVCIEGVAQVVKDMLIFRLWISLCFQMVGVILPCVWIVLLDW